MLFKSNIGIFFCWLVIICLSPLPRQAEAFSAPASTATHSKTWQFRGYDIYAESTPPEQTTDKPSVLLVHGFGCSTVYWRETVATLAQAGYQVHALDLLGQGKSAKPGRGDGIEYSIDLWAELTDQYAKEHIPGDSIVLMGNSLGSLVALVAATGEGCSDSYIRERVKGIGMYNCGIGMNSRNIAKEPQWSPAQRFALNRVFDLINFVIFGNLPLLRYVLENVVTRDLLREALVSLYPCAENPAERVDAALVDSFFLPAQDAGAVEALSQIYCNDPGPTPMELHERHEDFLKENVPIHLVWGDSDNVTPIAGGLGQYYIGRSNEKDSNISLKVISSGHIPFDEVPEVANGAMLQWLDNLPGKVN